MSLLARSAAWAKAGLLLLILGACGGDPLDRLAEGGRGRVDAALPGGLVRMEDGATVRLAGLDVPGRGEPGWAEAEARLAELMDERIVSMLHGGPGRDGFGRALVHLRTQGDRLWVQGALLDAGLARVRTTPADRAMTPEMLDREARARTAGRGLWRSEAWRVRLPQEARPGFVLVEGRIAPSPGGTGPARLAFVQPGLQLQLTRRALDDLSAAGAPPSALAGRLVRVRGVVRRSGAGLVLVIDHPEQMEMLADEQ